PLPISKNDMFLLCSDGLWGLIEDVELLRIAAENADLQAACRDMVALANERGGRDNITVQLVRIGAGDQPVDAAAPRPGRAAAVRRTLGEARGRGRALPPPTGSARSPTRIAGSVKRPRPPRPSSSAGESSSPPSRWK